MEILSVDTHISPPGGPENNLVFKIRIWRLASKTTGAAVQSAIKSENDTVLGSAQLENVRQ